MAAVSTELAQQIIEDVWCEGKPLDETRADISKRWKQVTGDGTGKVQFEKFLECYYFEAQAAEKFQISEETSTCGPGRCPGPWFFEWGFAYSLFLPLAVYLWVTLGYIVGNAEDGRPKSKYQAPLTTNQSPRIYLRVPLLAVYTWSPETIIWVSFAASWLAQVGIMLCACWRSHILVRTQAGCRYI